MRTQRNGAIDQNLVVESESEFMSASNLQVLADPTVRSRMSAMAATPQRGQCSPRTHQTYSSVFCWKRLALFYHALTLISGTSKF